MKKILVTMMALVLTIAAQAQQYDGINTYTYDYTLCGRTIMMKATFMGGVNFRFLPGATRDWNFEGSLLREIEKTKKRGIEESKLGKANSRRIEKSRNRRIEVRKGEVAKFR